MIDRNAGPDDWPSGLCSGPEPVTDVGHRRDRVYIPPAARPGKSPFDSLDHARMSSDINSETCQFSPPTMPGRLAR